jgi:hypothetical protein
MRFANTQRPQLKKGQTLTASLRTADGRPFASLRCRLVVADVLSNLWLLPLIEPQRMPSESRAHLAAHHINQKLSKNDPLPSNVLSEDNQTDRPSILAPRPKLCPSSSEQSPPVPLRSGKSIPSLREIDSLPPRDGATARRQVPSLAPIQKPSLWILAEDSFASLPRKSSPQPITPPSRELSFDFLRPRAHRHNLPRLQFRPSPLINPPPACIAPKPTPPPSSFSRVASKFRSIAAGLSCCATSPLPHPPPFLWAPELESQSDPLQPPSIQLAAFDILRPLPSHRSTSFAASPPPLSVVVCQVCGTSHSLVPPRANELPSGVGLLSTCGCNIFVHRGGGCSRRFVVARMRASQVLEEGGSFSDLDEETGWREGGGRIFECAMRCGDTVRMDAVVYF